MRRGLKKIKKRLPARFTQEDVWFMMPATEISLITDRPYGAEGKAALGCCYSWLVWLRFKVNSLDMRFHGRLT